MNADKPESARPSALASLRRYLRPREVVERCELCDLVLPPVHSHLVELATRRLRCACEACAVLFSHQAAQKYRRVPRGASMLQDFRLSDAQWQALQVPIHLAFFLHSTPAGKVVAFYPSPEGATESALAPQAWQALIDENPVLRTLEPDVEALLVNRLGAAPEHYRVGIDECYRLVGLIRQHWRGFSGGLAVWQEIGQFFATLKARSHRVGGRADA